MISSIDRRRSIVCASSSSSASVTAVAAARSSSSRRRIDGLALLVARRAELGRIALDPRLDLRDRLLLPLAEPGELGLQVALGAVEVVGDALQALVEPPLGRREHVRERFAGAALALRERRQPLGREPPLLGRELRHRVGALAGERAPDLLRVRRRLLVRRGVHGGPGCGDERVGVGGALARAPERQPEDDGDDDGGGEAGGEDPDGHAGTL